VKRMLLVALVACRAPHTGMPPLGDVSAIDVEQKQGRAPARCGLVDYRVHIDLAAGTWSSGLCTVDWQAPDALQAPLVAKQGTLTPAQRDDIKSGYRKLAVSKKQDGCGYDGGDLTLTVTRKDGSSAKFLDENWGCRKPPPVIVDGLPVFARSLMQLAL
jgi:hypothetical protein